MLFFLYFCVLLELCKLLLQVLGFFHWIYRRQSSSNIFFVLCIFLFFFSFCCTMSNIFFPFLFFFIFCTITLYSSSCTSVLPILVAQTIIYAPRIFVDICQGFSMEKWTNVSVLMNSDQVPLLSCFSACVILPVLFDRSFRGSLSAVCCFSSFILFLFGD